MRSELNLSCVYKRRQYVQPRAGITFWSSLNCSSHFKVACEDLKAFERRLTEIIASTTPTTLRWRLLLAVVSVCVAVGAVYWLQVFKLVLCMLPAPPEPLFLQLLPLREGFRRKKRKKSVVFYQIPLGKTHTVWQKSYGMSFAMPSLFPSLKDHTFYCVFFRNPSFRTLPLHLCLSWPPSTSTPGSPSQPLPCSYSSWPACTGALSVPPS